MGTSVDKATQSVTTAVASSLVAKSGAGELCGFSVSSGASAGYIMLFDAASAPIDGAVTPMKTYNIAATSTFDKSFPIGRELRFLTGMTIVFSTTGPFSKTASATAMISAETI